jgi:tRNA threonylcarbamoyl adenosine modification protein YeaZ
MLCLGIDTTGAACSAALVDDTRVLASKSQIIHRGHAEVLGPMVENLFLTTKTRAKDLGKISVCTGPGSFTGLRVGLSFAKGLALPWQIPVIGVSGLEAWAHMTDPDNRNNVMAIADVRRGEVFWQRFEHGQAVAHPLLSGVEDALNALKPNDMIVGNGAALLGGQEQDGIISPTIIAWMGLERSAAIYPAEPLYHRPPDAKLPGGRTLESSLFN